MYVAICEIWICRLKKKNKNKRSDFLVTKDLALDNIPLVFEIFVQTNLAINKRVNNTH